MLSGSPLSKDWKTAKAPAERKEKPPKILGRGEGKRLTQRNCDSGQCQWIDRWLKNYIQSYSLPPQIAGTEAHSNAVKFMGADKAEELFTKLRADFNQTYPPPPGP
jgi:hypothetical protein